MDNAEHIFLNTIIYIINEIGKQSSDVWGNFRVGM